jgi:uncharacterized membrane protein
MIIVNSVLAVIPLLCGWLMFKTRQKLLQGAFVVLWFAFLPNTLYILTDMRYLPEQWPALSTLGKLGLTMQYLVYELLGVSSFLLALFFLEKTWLRSRWREHKVLLVCFVITINFLIGFGMVLGRVHRLNSWDIFFATPKVIDASFQTLFSLELLLPVVLFGGLANMLYFLFKLSRGVIAVPASRLW